jgi:hypothetical protein
MRATVLLRCASPLSRSSAPRNRRTQSAPNTSLSLRGKPLRSASAPGCFGYDARSCSALSARLNHHRANAPRRVFPQRDKIPRPRAPLVCPIAQPFAPDCELSIPLERLRLETHRLALYRWCSLGNFKSRHSTPLFGLSADPRPIFPTRAASPNAPLCLRLQKFPSEPVDARPSWFMLPVNPA